MAIKKIFDIVEGVVVLNENCLLIPEFERIHKKFKKDAIRVFSFIYYYCDHKSPYADFDESTKLKVLNEHYNSDGIISMEDPFILKGIEAYNRFSKTPLIALLEAAKDNLYKITIFLKTTSVTDKTIGQVNTVWKSLSDYSEKYNSLVKEVEKEQNDGKVRGDKFIRSRER